MNDEIVLKMHFNDKYLGKITREASDQILKYAETHSISLEKSYSLIDWHIDCITVHEVSLWKKEVLVEIKNEDD